MIRRFLGDDQGSTSIEYGVMAALVSVVILAAVSQMGLGVSYTFRVTAATIESGSPAVSAESSSSTSTAATTRGGSESGGGGEFTTSGGATRSP